MTNKTNLPTTKTLSTEEMKSIRGGLLLNRYSLRTQSTNRFSFGSYGVVEMNGITGGTNTFGSYGVVEMNG